MTPTGSMHKQAGYCAHDCGGFLNRGDAPYWLFGGGAVAILIIVLVGLIVLKRRQGSVR